MNIHKSRLAALIGLMLMVCMMVAMLVVPASAATFEVNYSIGLVDTNKIAASVYELANADLHDSKTYSELAVLAGYALGAQFQCNVSPDGNSVYLPESNVAGIVSNYNKKYPDTPITVPELPHYSSVNGDVVYRIPAYGCTINFGPTAGKYTYSTTGKLVDSLEDNSLSGVLDQIIDLLPIVIPVLIGFIGLNKAVKFITGVLHSA